MSYRDQILAHCLQIVDLAMAADSELAASRETNTSDLTLIGELRVQIADLKQRLADAMPPTTEPVPEPEPAPAPVTIYPGGAVALVDKSGNNWTITDGGQVSMNGAVDTRTKGVIEGFLFNSLFYQKTAADTNDKYHPKGGVWYWDGHWVETTDPRRETGV